MKVGIYDPYLDDTGGGEKYMLTIAEVLSQNHTVSVFWNNKEDLEKGEKQFGLDLSRVRVARNIFAPHVSFWKRMQESKKYDAIIFLSDGSLPIVRSHLYVHFQHPLEHVHPSFVTGVKAARVKAFFVNSEFTKSYIDKTFHVRSRLIYPPVFLNPKKIKKTNTILHVGRFRVYDHLTGSGDYKKQHVMLSVFKEMVDQGLKNWKLVMVVSVKDEDNEKFEKMRETVKDYPVEFQVNKGYEKLWEFYSAAKIYWHASGYGEDIKKHPELAEHFGISTVEAMGEGAVPVVINAGGQTEIVTDGVNGFLWNTLDEFKEKTMTLIESPKLLDTLSDKAKSRAQDFSKSVFERKIAEMIA